jgi:hypothetical protein
MVEQQVDAALDDHGKVATRDRVAHEVSALLELPAKYLARRELDSVARLAERLYRCSPDTRRTVRLGKWAARNDWTSRLLFPKTPAKSSS